MGQSSSVENIADLGTRCAEVRSDDARAFLATLHHTFAGELAEVLRARAQRQAALEAASNLDLRFRLRGDAIDRR